VISLSPSEVALYYAARAPQLRQRGKRWRSPCPIHGGKHDSFSVDPETGLWRCWSSCGRGGDIIALEMALTGATWREAVAEAERILGRVLLDRPATRAERRVLAERHELEQREIRVVEFFRIAATSMAEQILEQLPEAVCERYGPTQLLLNLRNAQGAALLTVYHDYRAREPRLAAALVSAGELEWHRMCTRLARFVAEGAEVRHVA
jgi:CHC2 zinc finger